MFNYLRAFIAIRNGDLRLTGGVRMQTVRAQCACRDPTKVAAVKDIKLSPIFNDIGVEHPTSGASTTGCLMRFDYRHTTVYPWSKRTLTRCHANGAATAWKRGVRSSIIEIILTVQESNLRSPEPGVTGYPGRPSAEYITLIGPVD